MELKIFTPGHGFFMDSLIMYGLVSAFPPDVKYHVSGTAGFFKIEIEGAALQEVANFLAGDIGIHLEDIIECLVNNLRVVQKGSQKRLKSYLDSHKNPDVLVESFEKNYMLPGHAQHEGRYYKGQHVWLPFYPHIGKYFAGEYRYPPVNYGICPTCVTLAALGFYKATIPIRYMPPKSASHIILLSFEGESSGEMLAKMPTFIRGNALTELINKLRPVAENLPVSTLTYVLLTRFTSSLIRDLYESKAIWTALSTTFDVIRGQVVQIRGYDEVTIDGYLSSLVFLMRIDEKYNIDPLKRLGEITEDLIRKKETAAMEALYKFMNTRSYMDLYVAIRQIIKALGEGPGKIFCEELACLTQLT